VEGCVLLYLLAFHTVSPKRSGKACRRATAANLGISFFSTSGRTLLDASGGQELNCIAAGLPCVA
jgi:hypothetical protein